MSISEFRKSAFKPIIYPEDYLHNRIEERYCFVPGYTRNLCLLKYFPKYYKKLNVEQRKDQAFLFSKVKQVKVIRNFYCEMCYYEEASKTEKTLKSLLRTSRKTLKRLPKDANPYHSKSSMSMRFSEYFQKITHLDVHCYPKREQDETLSPRWRGSLLDIHRFISSLEIRGDDSSPLEAIRKINKSKRFLSTLKNLNFRLSISENNSKTAEILCELLKNKEFLKHITCFNFEKFPELIRYRDLFEAISKYCTNLKFLSFSYYLFPDQDVSRSLFPLNDWFPNLQILHLKINDIPTFADCFGISFPLGIQKIIFIIAQDNWRQELSQNSGKNFASFFEKWRRLENLRTLDLKLPVVSKMEIMAEYFILPIVRAIPQLETFNCYLRDTRRELSEQEREFNLNAFFKAIEPLNSLKNVRFTREKADFGIFSVAYNPGKISFFPNLSIIEIDTNCSPSFNLNKFLILFLHGLKSEPEEMEKEKSIKFSRIRLANVPDLVKLFRVLNTASQFRRLKICLQVDLFAESMGELTSNLQSPMFVASNVALKLDIYFVSEVLREKYEEYFKRIFRYMEWNVWRAKKDAFKTDYTKHVYRGLLFGQSKERDLMMS